jgi:hypothetical protein
LAYLKNNLGAAISPNILDSVEKNVAFLDNANSLTELNAIIQLNT